MTNIDTLYFKREPIFDMSKDDLDQISLYQTAREIFSWPCEHFLNSFGVFLHQCLANHAAVSLKRKIQSD